MYHKNIFYTKVLLKNYPRYSSENVYLYIQILVKRKITIIVINNFNVGVIVLIQPAAILHVRQSVLELICLQNLDIVNCVECTLVYLYILKGKRP